MMKSSNLGIKSCPFLYIVSIHEFDLLGQVLDRCSALNHVCPAQVGVIQLHEEVLNHGPEVGPQG